MVNFKLEKSMYDKFKGRQYEEAIDYLTLATAASASEEVRDYTDLINRLKFRTNYNGVVLTKKDN